MFFLNSNYLSYSSKKLHLTHIRKALASKRAFETLVKMAGVESDKPCTESPVAIKDSDFSPETLIKVLTKISGTDRQKLTPIVQRWGSLSDELKRAVEALAEKPVFFYPSISLL